MSQSPIDVARGSSPSLFARAQSLLRAVLSLRWLARVQVFVRWLVVEGPDPIGPTQPSEEVTWLDTLLVWPIRLLIVAGMTLVALVWADSPAGVQLGWALQYGLLVAVSIVMAFWLPILIVNTLLAAAWLVLSWSPPPPAPPGVPRWGPLDVVTWLNRQVSHVETLAAWIAVSFVVSHCLVLQAALFASVIFLGGPIINGIAKTKWFGGKKARRSRAALMMERRSVIYIASLTGLVLLALQAWKQIANILPLVATVLPGLALRFARHRHRKRQERGAARGDNAGAAAAGTSASAATGISAAFAPSGAMGAEASAATGVGADNPVYAQRMQHALLQQHPVARVGGTAFAALSIVAFFVGTAALSMNERHKIAAGARGDDDGPPPPTDRCAPEPGGPVVPTLAMFVIADTQMHELGGKPFPGQMEVADTFVPVARRPVELDMLSTAAVVRYQKVYRDLIAERAELVKKAQEAGARLELVPPLWAHLGDFADLSCTGEMARMVALLDGYAPGTRTLAGIAPGNHDMSFQGNFGWSPFWDTACPSGRLDKANSDDAVGKVLAARWAGDGREPLEPPPPLMRWAPPHPFGLVAASRYIVTPLGTVPARDGRSSHGVLAVFFDTSDQDARDNGIAGSFGAFSKDQRERIEQEITRRRRERGPGDPYADPWFVLMGHHPYAELTGASRKELDELVGWLDANKDDCRAADGCEGARVLALVTAHTHTAESHRHCVNQRLVREIVVGSVIDPPEQASWLEIGADAQGHPSLRLSTLPSVAREGLVCSNAHAIDAGVCRRAIGVLTAAPECQALVASDGAGNDTAASCESLERPLSLSEQLDGIARHGGPTGRDEIEKIERRRALALLDCVCRDRPGDPAPPECAALRDTKMRRAPLDGEAYAPIIARLAAAVKDDDSTVATPGATGDPTRQEELTCLAWAAAALQQHKATGMTMADAIRCAFDDPTLPPAQVTVASAEEVPCH